jgi:hypothetical protein
MYVLGTLVFAALAVILTVSFVKKWRRSND